MIKIVVDSTADLNPELRDLVTVVPLTVIFDDKEYVDGVTISHKEFYEKLVESDVLPTTSQATPSAFTKAFEEITSAGDTVIVLTISSKLSGTYQSAMIASQDFEGKVFVIDSKTVAIGLGILVEHALDLVKQGMNEREIIEHIEKEKNNVRVIAMLDTLEYLKKGGRISKVAAVAGGILSIKPVISIEDGEIKMLGKARGSKQGNNLLVSEIEKAGGVDFSMPLLLGYTGLSDVLLKKYINDSISLWEGNAEQLSYTTIGSAVGTHAGPGAVAVAFFKKSDG